VAYSERVSGQPYASAVAADGKIYVVTRQSGALVLAAKPKFELLSHNRLDDRSFFNASPAVSGGRLFLRSDKFLYCIGKKEAKAGG
jgi:outer membrane protein assembly factor BamB